MDTFKHVRQLDDSGCGIACIAMIAGKSYTQVKYELLKQKIISKEENEFYANFSKLNKFAKALGISLKSRKKADKWANIPETSIVSTDYGKTNWHWVLFVKNKNDWYVYDPNDLKGKGGIKLRSMRGRSIRWYLPIEKSTSTPFTPSS
jgi:ABC-type bacteriocin/lantibiotic exporter with double-glycine peptidase domain